MQTTCGKLKLANILGTTRHTIHRLTKNGILPSIRTVDGHQFNVEECLVAYKEHQRTASKYYPKGVGKDANGILARSLKQESQGGTTNAH